MVIIYGGRLYDKSRVGAANYDAVSRADEAILVHQSGQVACFQVSRRIKLLSIRSKAELFVC